jgi:hypothetical protein
VRTRTACRARKSDPASSYAEDRKRVRTLCAGYMDTDTVIKEMGIQRPAASSAVSLFRGRQVWCQRGNMLTRRGWGADVSFIS